MTSPYYPSHPNLIERHYGCVDLSVYNSQLSSSTKSLKFVGTNYFSDPIVEVDLFTIPVSATFRSPGLVRSKINKVEENNRGITRAQFDPDDYAAASFNGEGAINFVKVVELDSSGTAIRTSPWLIIPPPGFFSTGRKNLTLKGVAPSVSSPGTYVGLPPDGSLVLKLPRYSDYITITELDANHDLFVATDPGSQEDIVGKGTEKVLNEAGATLIFLRGDGNKPEFLINFAIVNGIEA